MRISVFWGSLSLVAESPDFFQTRDLSLQREVSHIIDRGNGWLLTQQRKMVHGMGLIHWWLRAWQCLPWGWI